MTALIVILIIVVVLIVLIVLGAVGGYNSLVRLRNRLQESWRQVDVELNRRYELIPNLVETVRGYAAHERNTLEGITQLRNQAAAAARQGGGTPSPERDRLEGELSGAVRQLMVSVEAYPDLKSNQNFLELQRELSATEDRIANGRRYYNANVRAYNTRIETVPTNILANMFHFQQATYFQVDDPAVRQAPAVNFGEIAYRADQRADQQPAADPAAGQGQLGPAGQQQVFPAYPPQQQNPAAQPADPTGEPGPGSSQ